MLSFIITPQLATDWASVRSELITRRNAFNSNNFVEYVFSAKRGSCECMPCSTAMKYITVKDDVAIDVTFSDSTLNCDETSLYDPDYRTINGWFNVSIDYVDDYNECDGIATQTTAGLSCNDVSLSITYDDIYNYPTSIIFDEAAMAYDGGSAWYFECFDPYSDGIKDTENCDYTATFPSDSSTSTSLPTDSTSITDSLNSNPWDLIKLELIAQQIIFNSTNGYDFNQYVYSSQISCECTDCDTKVMYNTVNDDEWIDTSFADNDNNECVQDDISDSHKRTINDWFNIAIEYCETWRYCDEIITTTDQYNSCTDRSLDVVYDEIFGHPVEMIFDLVATYYDGGAHWYFQCFTPYKDDIAIHVPTNYDAICDFTPNFADNPYNGSGYRRCVKVASVVVIVIVIFLIF